MSEFVIHISDINDNTPQFLHAVHRGTIPENADNNTFIAVVSFLKNNMNNTVYHYS